MFVLTTKCFTFVIERPAIQKVSEATSKYQRAFGFSACLLHTGPSSRMKALPDTKGNRNPVKCERRGSKTCTRSQPPLPYTETSPVLIGQLNNVSSSKGEGGETCFSDLTACRFISLLTADHRFIF